MKKDPILIEWIQIGRVKWGSSICILYHLWWLFFPYTHLNGIISIGFCTPIYFILWFLFPFCDVFSFVVFMQVMNKLYRLFVLFSSEVIANPANRWVLTTSFIHHILKEHFNSIFSLWFDGQSIFQANMQSMKNTCSWKHWVLQNRHSP